MKSKIIALILVISAFCFCRLNSLQSDTNYVNVSDINNTKAFRGYIKYRLKDELSFKTEGKISFLPYSKGDFVRKGQVIARLDGVLFKIKGINDEFNYNVIIAPYDSYIEEIYEPLNSHIKANQPVVALCRTIKSEAEVLVPAKYINKIDLKNKGFVEFKNLKYEVKISDIKKSDDNYLIELEFDNLYKDLKEGTNISAVLNLNK